MNADENSEKNFDYQLLNLFISVVPRGEMFIGKNGTGLMTLAEFTNIVDEGYQSGNLQFKTQSAAFLDDSIDFNRDAGGALILEHSAGQTTSVLLTDRNMRSAMQEDATRLVERFTADYKGSADEENTPIQQITEMFEFLVKEGQHEILGVSPEALQGIFDLLFDKVGEVKMDYDELVE